MNVKIDLPKFFIFFCFNIILIFIYFLLLIIFKNLYSVIINIQ